MRASSRLPDGVRRLFRLPWSRKGVRQDLDDEVRFHLEMRAANLSAQGMSLEHARAEALRRFGDVSELRAQDEQTAKRRARWRPLREWVRDAGADVWIAGRRLGNTPSFTIATVLTVGVAIGAAASVYGLVDGVLLDPFPFRDPGRVVSVVATNVSQHILRSPASPLTYVDSRDQSTAFEELAAADFKDMAVTGGQESERLHGLAVTPNYFPALGVAAAAGRFLASDSAGPAEVVISDEYWQRQFGGSPAALGQKLTLDGLPFTIVGVMPPNLPDRADYQIDLWTRLSFTAADVKNPNANRLRVYGRLKPGVTIAGAEHQLQTVAARIVQAYPWAAGWSLHVTSIAEDVVGSDRTWLLALLGAACCVLLVGAANLGTLFLVRCLGREQETALRLALGATRPRLAQELLIEAALVGLMGTVLGASLSIIGVRTLRVLAPTSLPRLGAVAVNARLFVFCAVAAVAIVLVFGALPAWQTARDAVATTLKAGARSTASPLRRALQSSLVVIQLAVALVLLTGASAFLKGFEHLRHLDPGFDPEHVLTAFVALPDTRYPTTERQQQFLTQLATGLNTIPGAQATAVSIGMPAGSMRVQLTFSVVGAPAPDSAHTPSADLVCASPGYFRTMSIPLARGRDFAASDGAHASEVMIVDALLARRFLAGHDALTSRLSFGSDTVQIVGLAGSVRQHGLAEDDVPVMYTPMAQCPYSSLAFASVRSAGTPQQWQRASDMSSQRSTRPCRYRMCTHCTTASPGPSIRRGSRPSLRPSSQWWLRSWARWASIVCSRTLSVRAATMWLSG